MRGPHRHPYLVGIIFVTLVACCYFLWVPTQKTTLPTSMHHLLPRRQGEGRDPALREHNSRAGHGTVPQPVEVWAAGTRQSNASAATTLWGLLTASEQNEVMDLCGRCAVCASTGSAVHLFTGVSSTRSCTRWSSAETAKSLSALATSRCAIQWYRCHCITHVPTGDVGPRRCSAAGGAVASHGTCAPGAVRQHTLTCLRKRCLCCAALWRVGYGSWRTLSSMTRGRMLFLSTGGQCRNCLGMRNYLVRRCGGI